MIKIYHNNKLPKMCNKKQAENLEALKIKDDDIYELLQEINRKDEFDIEFEKEDDTIREDDTLNSDKTEHINGDQSKLYKN